jgi:prepilin-type N-terminal cleavage/methylation domain-containing protein
MKNKNKKIRCGRRAFTLIEMLISIAIFTIFIGVVSESYVSIIRGQKQANEIRKMYSEVRNFVDFFGQEVRLGSIDYGSYNVTPGVNPCGNSVPSLVSAFNASPSLFQLTNGETTDLAVVRKDGLLKTYFHYDKEEKLLQIKQEQKVAGSWVSSALFSGGSYKNVLDDSVKVENLKFLISPDIDPYGDEYYCRNEKQFQPHVTLLMTVTNGANIKSEFSLNYQTTISSRVYSRL